jgi:hypothetical protein
MPNWVFNRVSLSGEPNLVQSVKEQLNKPYVSPFENTEVVNPIFSFWNIVSPDDLDAYTKQPDLTDNTSNVLMALITNTKIGGSDWYTWNHDNWGCKWDARDVDVVSEKEGEICYNFSTPWSEPKEALVALSKRYPELLVRNEWEEEQGYGAIVEYQGGRIISLEEFDSPDSHAAHLNHPYGEQECRCQYEMHDPSQWYEDCPVTDTHDWVNGQWVKKN